MASSNNTSKLQLIPESVLKKRHDLDDLARKRAALEALEPSRAKGKRRTKKNAVYVIKPETILSHSRNKRNHKVRYLRVQKKGMQKRASRLPVTAVKQIVIEEQDDTVNDTSLPDVHEVSYVANSVGSKMVFAIRIRDSVATPREVQNVLCHHLGLKRKHEGVFLRYDNETTRAWLHSVEPWVVYGPLPSSMIQDLLVRRGHARLAEERVPLSDNTIIEQALGSEHNILCVEDMVHEIATVGPAFDAIQAFLWPFQLADSKTELERRTLRKKDTKLEYGDRGEAIQDFLHQVL